MLAELQQTYIEKEEVYMRCMHWFWKKLEKIQFYCPKCMIDMSWYSIDDVVCEIDEAKKVRTRYKVDKSVWMPIVKNITSKNEWIHVKKKSTCNFSVSGVTLVISGVTVCLSSDYERMSHKNFYLRSILSCFKCNQK